MSQSLERLARNQVLFRELNERIREIVDTPDGRVPFLCECSHEGCVETLELRIPEYEHVRSVPNRFVVASGHELLEIERTVEENDGYMLVEKTVEADFATAHDPRSRRGS